MKLNAAIFELTLVIGMLSFLALVGTALGSTDDPKAKVAARLAQLSEVSAGILSQHYHMLLTATTATVARLTAVGDQDARRV